MWRAPQTAQQASVLCLARCEEGVATGADGVLVLPNETRNETGKRRGGTPSGEIGRAHV